jgi:cupin superfamily acireductone dioxygenase involved in methionine salvage
MFKLRAALSGVLALSNLAVAQSDRIPAQDTVKTEISFMQDWEGCKHVQTDNEIMFACSGRGFFVVDMAHVS